MFIPTKPVVEATAPLTVVFADQVSNHGPKWTFLKEAPLKLMVAAELVVDALGPIDTNQQGRPPVERNPREIGPNIAHAINYDLALRA